MNFEDLSTDLINHPITGYVPDGRYANLPLISHIEGNLYVGGCIDGVDLGDFFSHVFSMYKWGSYKVSESTKVHTVTMYDSHNVNAGKVNAIAEAVVVALAEGGNVLVHCQAGINRSNLIAGLVLMKVGLTSDEAITLLRQQRGEIVLANQAFESFLRNLD